MNTRTSGRLEGWRFGGASETWEAGGWFETHEPVVDAWLSELEASGGSWRSAEHAAFCLVSVKEERERRPSWDEFDARTFLLDEVLTSGTARSFGPPEELLENLIEAMRRFGDAGLIDAMDCRRWMGELRGLRDDFLRDVESSGVHTSLRRTG